MFSFQPLLKCWPLLRGSKTLSTLFSKDHLPLVSNVLVCPGHAAVLLRGSSMLCLFDTVPALKQLTDTEERVLMNVISKGDKDTQLKIQKIVLVSTHTAPIVNFWFEGSSTENIKLFAVQEDGILFAWSWQSSKHKWKSLGRVLLPPTKGDTMTNRLATRKRRITTVACSPALANSASSGLPSRRPHLVFWAETYEQVDSAMNDEENRGLHFFHFILILFNVSLCVLLNAPLF